MNYREERERRCWTTKQVAEQIGKSVAAVNGLENHDKGGFELRFLLDKLYGAAPASTAPSPPAILHDAGNENLIDEALAEVQTIRDALDDLERKLKKLK